jgi:alpha-N-arabinofuranosidase
MVDSYRRRRGHDGHQGALYRGTDTSGQAQCERAAWFQAIRNCGSQRPRLHRTHCARWLPRSGCESHAHLGQEAADQQTVAIRAVGASYHKFPLHFTAAADTDDATLEITGTGTGSFHVGTVSLMPADNIDGFRPEVIAALKQLRFGVLRFPGGNFVSSYEWRYGVGDIDKRPPIFDPVWHAVQPNDVGTDEFLTLCRLLGVDPYITVNAGFGDAWSARELVEYTNGAATTPMGKWRAANGHPSPTT